MINALLVLLSFQLAGEIITRTLQMPVPGPVLGMLLLFAALLLRDSLAAKIEPTTQFGTGSAQCDFTQQINRCKIRDNYRQE